MDLHEFQIIFEQECRNNKINYATQYTFKDLLSKKGLMQGKNEGNFDPKGMTTRAEVATLLMRLMTKMK